MAELIATIILFIGLIGMAIILLWKIPVLAELSPKEIKGPGVFGVIKNKIENKELLKTFSGEILLQKILSKFRILTLKTENKTNTWLGKLRQRSLGKKKKFSDDYWKKIRGKK